MLRCHEPPRLPATRTTASTRSQSLFLAMLVRYRPSSQNQGRLLLHEVEQQQRWALRRTPLRLPSLHEFGADIQTLCEDCLRHLYLPPQLLDIRSNHWLGRRRELGRSQLSLPLGMLKGLVCGLEQRSEKSIVH